MITSSARPTPEERTGPKILGHRIIAGFKKNPALLDEASSRKSGTGAAFVANRYPVPSPCPDTRPLMFDPARHSASLARAHALHQPGQDFLMDHVVTDLVDRLGAVKRHFDTGLALFGRTPLLADAMRSSGQVTRIVRIEEDVHIGTADHVSRPDDLGQPAAEADLAVAPFALHWANDLPGALIQIRRALLPDGFFMAVLPGPGTLGELRQSLLETESRITGGAAIRTDPLTDIRDAGTLLQRAGFALPVVDREDVTVRYDNVFDLIRDLRGFAANSQTNDRAFPLPRAVANDIDATYRSKFGDPDGRIRATFSFVFMSGWVPHESQQKPLAPGSAKVSLADALKAPDIPRKR